MRKKTISEAIVFVLNKEKAPLSPKEICQKIIEGEHYVFKSQNPAAIVSTEIRRHCENNIQASKRTLLFKKLANGRYWLYDHPMPK